MHVGQSRDQLSTEGPRSALWKPTILLRLDEGAQVSAGRELHHQTVQMARLQITGTCLTEVERRLRG